jgi:hypothetical protein
MKQSELSLMTMKKLIIIHQTLPVLNVQFLHLLLTAYNKMREIRSLNSGNKAHNFQHSYDVQIFNLNISQIKLPLVTNQMLIDAYETAFAYEISDSMPNNENMGSNASPFSLHLLIDFFGKNL